MNKQITTLVILTALVNLTTHAMHNHIDYKKSYGEFKVDKSPRLRKKQTQAELMQEIINDKSYSNELVRDAIIRSILHKQKLTEYILAK
jgi:hypothetical protein